MFTQNDVLEYTGMHGHAIRILWIDRPRALAWTYRLGSHAAQPEPAPLRELEQALRGGGARRLLVDPFAAAPAQEPVPPGYLALQAKAWSAVRALHADRQALYQPRERALLMASYASAHDISKSSVLRYLRRYWERGQTPDALLPDYGNSGAPGRTRAVTAGVKRGRPRKGGATGTNADDKMRAIFRAAAARYAASHDAFSRRDAYRQMLGEFFQGIDAGSVPSFGQFNYWLDRDGLAPVTDAARESAPDFAPDFAADSAPDSAASTPAAMPARPPAPWPGHAAPRFAQYAGSA